MSRIVDFFDGSQSSTTPTIGSIAASKLVVYADDASYEAAELGAPLEGNLYFNSTTKFIRYYKSGAWKNLTDEDIIAALQATVDTNTTNIATNATNIGTNTTNITSNDSDIATLQTDVAARILLTEKGANNGVATLDGSGLVPSAQLPSFVDDVLEFANFSALPVSGVTGKIYITLDDNKTYRWSGSAYIDIGAVAGDLTSDIFSGDGTTTAFTLSVAPTVEENTFVFISGVYQQKDTYSVAGTTLTFSEAPVTGTNNIEVMVVSVNIVGISDNSVSTVKLQDDSVTTVKIIDDAVTTPKILNGAITQAKRAALGHQLSASSGTFSVVPGTTAKTDVTNLTVTITTTGRPIVLRVIPDGSASDALFSMRTSSANAPMSTSINIVRDATVVYRRVFTGTSASASTNDISIPDIHFIDTPSAGTYTYKISVGTNNPPAQTIFMFRFKLLAYEL